MSDEARKRRVTVPAIRNSKVRNGAEPLVMVTAYDAPSARVAEAAEVDMILVGDSVGMVVLGHDTTLEVTVADMEHHIRAVARATPEAMIVGDMPWLSFHVNSDETVRNAARLILAGAACVKIEGGAKRIPMMEAVMNAEIPVIAHMGLTPQSYNATGGFKLQARDDQAVKQLVADAKLVQESGCFAILLEGVPGIVGQLVTDELDIPTIGIGAGVGCDGQVLVYHDVIGLEQRFKPRFVRRFGDAYSDQVGAVSAYAQAVRNGTFPGDDETYGASEDLERALGLYGSAPKET